MSDYKFKKENNVEDFMTPERDTIDSDNEISKSDSSSFDFENY